MSSIVFAGSAQFVAVGLGQSPPPLIALTASLARRHCRPRTIAAALAPPCGELPKGAILRAFSGAALLRSASQGLSLNN